MVVSNWLKLLTPKLQRIQLSEGLQWLCLAVKFSCPAHTIDVWGLLRWRSMHRWRSMIHRSRMTTIHDTVTGQSCSVPPFWQLPRPHWCEALRTLWPQDTSAPIFGAEVSRTLRHRCRSVVLKCLKTPPVHAVGRVRCGPPLCEPPPHFLLACREAHVNDVNSYLSHVTNILCYVLAAFYNVMCSLQ